MRQEEWRITAQEIVNSLNIPHHVHSAAWACVRVCIQVKTASFAWKRANHPDPSSSASPARWQSWRGEANGENKTAVGVAAEKVKLKIPGGSTAACRTLSASSLGYGSYAGARAYMNVPREQSWAFAGKRRLGTKVAEGCGDNSRAARRKVWCVASSASPASTWVRPTP